VKKRKRSENANNSITYEEVFSFSSSCQKEIEFFSRPLKAKNINIFKVFFSQKGKEKKIELCVKIWREWKLRENVEPSSLFTSSYFSFPSSKQIERKSSLTSQKKMISSQK
jgi:hypothetical protein